MRKPLSPISLFFSSHLFDVFVRLADCPALINSPRYAIHEANNPCPFAPPVSFVTIHRLHSRMSSEATSPEHGVSTSNSATATPLMKTAGDGGGEQVPFRTFPQSRIFFVLPLIICFPTFLRAQKFTPCPFFLPVPRLLLSPRPLFLCHQLTKIGYYSCRRLFGHRTSLLSFSRIIRA